MKYLNQSVLYIIIVSILFYVISNYLPWLGFQLVSEYSNEVVIYLFVGVVSWFINFILKTFFSLLTMPISVLTFWLFSLFVNFILLYVFEQVISYLDVWVLIVLWNVVQVFVLSCLLSIICFLVKKI